MGHLSPKAYAALLSKARALSKKLPALIDSGVISGPQDYYKLLNVSDSPIAPLDADGTSRGYVVGPHYISQEFLKAKRDIDETVPVIEKWTRVKGRMLNRVQGGFSIGIGGYVAFCASQNYEMVREVRGDTAYGVPGLDDFWVLDARVDASGKKEIHVSRRNPEKTGEGDGRAGERVVQSFGNLFGGGKGDGGGEARARSIGRMMDLLAGRKKDEPEEK